VRRLLIVLAALVAITVAAANNNDLDYCMLKADSGMEAQACYDRARE
jgi:hypothetical protein